MHRTDSRGGRCEYARDGQWMNLALSTWVWRSIQLDIALAEPGPLREVRHVGSIAGSLASLDKDMRILSRQGRDLQVVYEAGTCGFVIWCHLNAQGTKCAVVAPSSIPKRTGDRIKTDRREAMLLARLARAGELTAIRAPGPPTKWCVILFFLAMTRCGSAATPGTAGRRCCSATALPTRARAPGLRRICVGWPD